MTVPCVSATFVDSAHAQAAPERWRPDHYYLGNWSLSVSALALAVAIEDATQSDRDWSWFPGDPSVRRHWSPDADSYSDKTAGLTIALPVLAEFARGPGPRFVNFSTVYAQTLAVNLALNAAAKRAVARRRPCTHHAEPPAKCSQKDDRYASFYSGHSSATFGAAMAGALMFSEGLDNGWVRGSFWAFEFGLATATANMRIAAGMHYYSDVLVGALVGAGIGLAIPSLHGTKPFAWSGQAARDDWAFDVAGATLGLGLGILTSELAVGGRATQSSLVDALELLNSVHVSVSGSGQAVFTIQGTL